MTVLSNLFGISYGWLWLIGPVSGSSGAFVALLLRTRRANPRME